MPMQIRGTVTPNSPPAGLVERQLSVEMGSTPPKLWCGVPVGVDASGRVQVSPPPDYVNQAALTAALAGYLPLTGLPLPIASGGTTTGTLPQVASVALPAFLTSNGTAVVANPVWGSYNTARGDLCGFSASDTAGNGPYIEMNRARGTMAARTAVQANDQLGVLAFKGFPTATGTTVAIEGNATQTHTATAGGGRLDFWVTANNTRSSGRALTLDQDMSATFRGAARGISFAADPAAGNVAIDVVTGFLRVTGSMQASANPGGTVEFYNNTTVHAPAGFYVEGCINAFSNGALQVLDDLGVYGIPYANQTNFTLLSDARVKTAVGPYRGGLKELLALELITFRYNGVAGTPQDPPELTRIGLDAAAAAGVMPELRGKPRMVKLDPQDHEETEVLSLDVSALPYAIINALRELDARVAKLGG